MFVFLRSNAPLPATTLATFATFEAACDHARALSPVCFEIDADYAGCADMFGRDGQVYIIQPKKG